MFLKEYERKIERRFLVILSVLYLAAPLLLFPLKGLDDNTLVSWGKVFQHADPFRVYLVSAATVPLAWALSRFRGPGPLGQFAIAFVLGSAFWHEPEVIVDASRYAVQAKHLSTYGINYFLSEWGRGLFAWTDMPLMPFLFGLAFKASGESRWAVQVLNTLCFAGTVSLTSLTGRELFSSGEETDGHDHGNTIGDTAAGLLLAVPYLYSQVPLMLVDVGSMFFLMLSIWLFIKAMKTGGVYVLAAAIGAAAVVFSKYSLWLMLSAHGIIYLILLRETKGTGLRRGLLVVLFSLMLTGPALLYYQEVLDEQIRLLMTYQRTGLEKWGETFTSTFLFQMHPLIILSAFFSIWAAIRRVDIRYVIIAWLVVLLVGVLHVRRIRYLMPVFPWISLMAAFGLAGIKHSRVRRFMVSAAVLMSVSLAAFGYMKFLNVNNLVNLRAAGAYLDSLDTPGITVLTYPQRSSINPVTAVPLLDLYTSKQLTYKYVFKSPLTREQVKNSSFRFTWAYKNPEYYVRGEEHSKFIAVIAPQTPEPGDERLAGYELFKVFDISEGFYRFKPFVYVYKENIDKDINVL